MVKELTSYQDEVFGLLFRDIAGFSGKISEEVFHQRDRRISIYGVRGMGKTTAMQGAVWLFVGSGEKEGISDHFAANVVVSGAKGIQDARQLSDIFHRSVILGVSRVADSSAMKQRVTGSAGRYAPWVAKKITEGAGIVFGPAALASDAVEKGVKWLVDRLGYSSIDSLLASRSLDPGQASTLLLDRLEKVGKRPMFIIDELDKVDDDVILSDFFDGNQAWFQGKQAILSLSYTFGESLKKTLVTAASRISRLEAFPGVTSFDDASEIIRGRARLGLSQTGKEEHEVRELADRLIPDDVVGAVLNVSAPNTYVMLERMSRALDLAIQSKSTRVLPEYVATEESEGLVPTPLEVLVLNELKAGRLSPSVVSERLEKDRGLVTRILRKMMERDWVGRVGSGKRAYYHITAKGEAALRRKGNKG